MLKLSSERWGLGSRPSNSCPLKHPSPQDVVDPIASDISKKLFKTVDIFPGMGIGKSNESMKLTCHLWIYVVFDYMLQEVIT